VELFCYALQRVVLVVSVCVCVCLCVLHASVACALVGVCVLVGRPCC
jgi:hypothetical protein